MPEGNCMRNYYGMAGRGLAAVPVGLAAVPVGGGGARPGCETQARLRHRKRQEGQH